MSDVELHQQAPAAAATTSQQNDVDAVIEIRADDDNTSDESKQYDNVKPAASNGNGRAHGHSQREHSQSSWASRQPVRLVWEDLSFSVPLDNKGGTKQILHSNYGVAEPGEVLAIMGASGAGKSTLLNVLSQRVVGGAGELTGKLTVNGQPVDLDVYQDFAAYVMQSDVLLETMTVRESLEFSALLRLPRSMPIEEKLARVDRIIDELGLAKCQDTYVGGNQIRGVSGGERKRVSVGVELITDPSLLFVDEPTSGLDSFTATSIMRTLHKLASHGRTVVCTIHQPSSAIFNQFDKLLLLSHGRVVFHGPTRDAVEHFSRLDYKCPQYTNPADFFLEAIHKDQGENKLVEAFVEPQKQLVRHGNDNDNNNDKQQPLKLAPLEPRAHEHVVWPMQLKHLMARSWKNIVRQPVLTRLRFVQNVFMGVLCGLIFFNLGDDQKSVQDRSGGLFFIMTNQLMLSIMSVILTFPYERVLFLRESANNMYSTSAYFLGKSLSELPWQLLFPSIYCAISYWMMGLQADFGKFLTYLLINILLVNVGQSMGMLVGSLSSSPEAAVGAAPMAIIPFMLFGGFFLNTESIPVYFVWLEYISPFKYGFEGLVKNEFDGLSLVCPPAPKDCAHVDGAAVLDSLNVERSIAFQCLMLVVLMVGYRLAAYIALRVQSSKKVQ